MHIEGLGKKLDKQSGINKLIFDQLKILAETVSEEINLLTKYEVLIHMLKFVAIQIHQSSNKDQRSKDISNILPLTI